MKKLLTLSIALMLIISSGLAVFAEATDYDKSWAKEEITYMMEKGILSGYPDGSFKPKNDMTNAEFYTVINGLVGFTEKGEVKFTDVEPSDWFYGQVEKGLKAGYILPAATLNPNAKITRGEVARIISVVFEIEENKAEAEKFVDYADMPENLKGVIGGLKAKGLVAGHPDGTFKSSSNIIRAEVVKMLHNVSGELVNKEGAVSKNTQGNFTVNTSNVELKDMTIDGDLYLTEGIGEGDVTLDNVRVYGSLIVKAGGEDSIIIKNSNINNIIVNKTKGTKVRLVLENTVVNTIKTLNNVKLELTKGTTVILATLDGTVELLADKDVTMDTVKAESKNVKINGEAVEVNAEVKVAEGKASVKEAVKEDKKEDKNTSGGGGRGVSSSRPLTHEERIISDHRSELRSLEITAKSGVGAIVGRALGDIDGGETKAEIYSKYKIEIEALEGEIDKEFESILSDLKSELQKYDYTYTSVISGFRSEYESSKTSLRAVYDELNK